MFANQQRGRDRKPLFSKLTLEVLEDRCVPFGGPVLSTVTITALQNGTESGIHGIFQVSRDKTAGNLTILYAVDAGSTAVSGVDFASLSGSVTIPSGASSANIDVSPLDAQVYGGSKTVTLDLESNSGGSNYTIGSPNSATLTITDNDLLITANNIVMTYADGTTLDGASGFTTTGLQNGDSIGAVTLTTDASLSGSGNWNAGSWTITPSAASGGTFNASDYAISYAVGILTVNPESLTVSGITASDKVYDGTTSATLLGTDSASLQGVVSSDDVGLDVTAANGSFASQNVGTGITVQVADLALTGADAADYTVTQPTTTADIISTAPTAWGNTTPLSVLRNNFTGLIDLSQYASDADGEPLQFSTVTQPSHGELDLTAGSTYVYISDPNYVGQDSFEFKANDGIVDSNVATFSLTVTNTAPTALDTGVYNVLKGQTLTISDLSTYGNSFSTNVLTPTIVQGPTYGQLIDLSNGQYQYVAPDYVTSDSFTYTLNDGLADSNVATVSINVVDLPIVANDVHLPIAGDVPVVISTADLLNNAQSVLTSPSFEVTSVSTPPLGQLIQNSDGTWTYTPPVVSDGYFNGRDTFTFTISDGVNFATANFTLFVPDRDIATDPAFQNEQRRADDMARVTQLFPPGVNLAAYQGLNFAGQTTLSNQLANSIQPGYLLGDTIIASTLISQLRNQEAFQLLNGMVQERTNAGGAVIGYRVVFWDQQAGGDFQSRNVDVPIPTQRDFMQYGCAFSAAMPPSLWYTIVEMAYVQQYGHNWQAPTGASSATTMGRLFGRSARSWNPGNIQQNDLVARLSDPAAITIAATNAYFTAPQQAGATLLGIDPGQSYAVVAYNVATQTVTLRNPKKRPDQVDVEPSISLMDFQVLFGSLTSTTAR